MFPDVVVEVLEELRHGTGQLEPQGQVDDPSRDMVLRLADVLAVPLRDRNRLLQAAGIAPAYPEAALQEPELAPFRRVIDSLLAAHEPFPGLVLDAPEELL